MLLCCHLPDLALLVHWQRHPEWRQQPLVVGGAPHERKVVRACSPAASQAGVTPGMPLRQAQQRCPSARFVALDEAGMERVGQQLLELLYQLAPEVELESSEHAYLNLEGLLPRSRRLSDLLTRVRTLLEACLEVRLRLGVGANKFVSRVAAGRAAADQPCVVPAGQEAAFLDPLPIALAPVPPLLLERLQVLGLHTLGAVAALPGPALWQQFGADGVRLYELAHGIDRTPLRPWQPPPRLSETTAFDPPLEDREALLFVGRRQADRLGERLVQAALACTQVSVRLDGDGKPAWSRVMRLPRAVGGSDVWPAVAPTLRAARPASPVAAMTLEISRLQPRLGRQLGLLIRRDAGQEQVQEALLRLQGRFREAIVCQPRVVDRLAPLAERRVELPLYQPGGVPAT